MYTWEEELTGDDSELFENGRYIGAVGPAVDGTWTVLFQPDPTALPPASHQKIGTEPTKVKAQQALIKFWERRSK